VRRGTTSGVTHERCAVLDVDPGDRPAAVRRDAGIPWYTARVEHCAEGPYIYLPYAYGTACYYAPETQQLLAISIADDTPYPCAESDTASFVYAVYGQWVSCTHATPVAVDAGTVVDTGTVDAGGGDDGGGR
jgi:hypothetical protein